MYSPVNYEQISIGAGANSPSSVKAYNNKTFDYWMRSLFQRATNVIDFEVPEEWEGNVKDFFIYCLFKYGFVAISKDAKHGQYFQPCTFSGFDFYYQPTKVLISNPDLSTELKIHKECELLKLTPDYMGIWDVLQYYAEKLSNLDNAINMSIINNKFAFILGGKNKASTQALKKMMDKINEGEPAVFYDEKLMDDPNTKDSPFQVLERPNLHQSYITSDQLMDFQTILNNFDAEVGIPTVPYQKKERMVAEEATARSQDAVARCEIWEKTLQSSIVMVKKLYPDIKLSAKLRYDIEEARLESEVDNGQE